MIDRKGIPDMERETNEANDQEGTEDNTDSDLVNKPNESTQPSQSSSRRPSAKERTELYRKLSLLRPIIPR